MTSVRLYTHIKVLNADGVPDTVGDIFDTIKGVSLVNSGGLPLCLDYSATPMMDLIGYSHVYAENNNAFFADLYVFPDHRMFQVIKDNIKNLFPSVGGMAHKKIIHKKGELEYQTITECTLTSLSIGYNFNCDLRIKSIGEQMEEAANL